jgi:hypothetical protein
MSGDNLSKYTQDSVVYNRSLLSAKLRENEAGNSREENKKEVHEIREKKIRSWLQFENLFCEEMSVGEKTVLQLQSQAESQTSNAVRNLSCVYGNVLT